MAAAALVKFKTQVFDTALALHAFVVADDSPVNTVTAVVFDSGSNKFVLFYMIA